MQTETLRDTDPLNPNSSLLRTLPPPPETLPASAALNDKEAARAADYEARKAAALLEIESRAFNASRPIEQPVPRFYVAGKGISTPGNLTSVIAQAKVGKSALIGAFIAALFAADNKARNLDYYGDDEPDTLGVTATAPRGKAVIHIDTEQSDYDHDLLIRTAMRRARIESKDAPAWFHSYRLAGYDAAKLQIVLHALIGKHSSDGIHAIILDGSADFVTDVNDAKECNPFVADLHAMAIACACPLIGIVHENPGGAGTGKGRGHFGSQLERKAESNICLKKDGDGITTIYGEKMRKASIPESRGPRFQWSDEYGMHMSTSSKAVTKADEKRSDLRELAEEAFGGAELLTFTELRDAVVKARGCSQRTAERKVENMRRDDICRNAGGGKLALSS